MKTQIIWKQKMNFEGTVGANTISIDAKEPIGQGKGPTPKELLAMAIAGCTGMDVVGLMRKYKEPLVSLEIKTEVNLTESHPTVFKDLKLFFYAKGGISKERLLEAIKLSQTKYCSVSAMLSKALPISYEVFLNNESIGEGKAEFV